MSLSELWATPFTVAANINRFGEYRNPLSKGRRTILHPTLNLQQAKKHGYFWQFFPGFDVSAVKNKKQKLLKMQGIFVEVQNACARLGSPATLLHWPARRRRISNGSDFHLGSSCAVPSTR
jgi:hypothetical protein